jgi:transposase
MARFLVRSVHYLDCESTSGVSRGDRNRNARLARLRVLVPVTNAIVGVDLADRKQMVVVCDHDSKVLARRTFRCRAWDLGSALDWARGRAAARGWGGVTVSCEPTGRRWRVLGQLAADRSMPFVCVQPMVTSWYGLPLTTFLYRLATSLGHRPYQDHDQAATP